MTFPDADGSHGRRRSTPDAEVLWPDEPTRRSRIPAMLAAGVAAAVLAGGVAVAYIMIAGVGSGSDTPAAPAATSPGTSESTDKDEDKDKEKNPTNFGLAAERSTDPKPLTTDELFKEKKIKGGFTRTADKMTEKCKDAVEGKKMKKAIDGTECTQFVRASYQDSSGDIIGTVGVANLADGEESAKLKKAWGQHDYLKPLPGSGPSKQLGSGQAQGQVFPHGHYAVMVWFQFQDGHAPSSDERKQLEEAANKVTAETVYKALDKRTTTGRPAN